MSKKPKKSLGVLGLLCSSVNCRMPITVQMIIDQRSVTCILDIGFVAAWWILSSFSLFVNQGFLIIL